ncbi:hypothetical protein [Nonomuraea sp. NPDC050202]|uniref:hypothetical protein n=1 Tax=Nonomuraea sp. NPDC050202 TaxID=3155035 RepID=UPI0034083D6B
MAETQPEPPASALYAVRYSYDWLRTWRYVVVQPSVKNVGLAAATFSNKRGLQVFPGVKRLMAITGHSKPSVIDALATMRYLGFLWRRSCGQGSESGQADEYQLSLPRTKDHLPMIDAKTGKEPALHTLPPIAQQTATRLGVAGRLSKRVGGQMTQPGWSTETTTLVRSVITIPIDTIGPMLAHRGASMTSTTTRTATTTSAITWLTWTRSSRR